MNKRELLLIALVAGRKHEHTPVQIQKLLFLIDTNVGAQIGGPVFNFAPFDYGPFDATVYEVLRNLEEEGLVASLISIRGLKRHVLTDEGVAEGKRLANDIDTKANGYIERVSKFVIDLSFSDLVAAVYKAHPEMKVNSIFRG